MLGLSCKNGKKRTVSNRWLCNNFLPSLWCILRKSGDVGITTAMTTEKTLVIHSSSDPDQICSMQSSLSDVLPLLSVVIFPTDYYPREEVGRSDSVSVSVSVSAPSEHLYGRYSVLATLRAYPCSHHPSYFLRSYLKLNRHCVYVCGRHIPLRTD